MNRGSQSPVNVVGGMRLPEYRFGIGLGGGDWRGWHAVDVKRHGPQLTAAHARGVRASEVDVFSVCGTGTQYVRRAGQFTYDSAFLTRSRCERCGWVVALHQGTVEQEIDLYVAAGGGADRGLLRQVFTAILADLPPGAAAEPGHRSDLLAHVARHRQTVVVCDACSQGHSVADVHGAGAAGCPESVLVCGSCTFTAGAWDGRRQGLSTGECVVAAPCSVLQAVARHYELLDNSWGVR